MRIALTSRYGQTLDTFFRCLSVDLFILLVLYLLNIVPNISIVIILSFLGISFVLIVRVFLSERKHEIFDISSATLFETGLLVFQSPKSRCAIFLAYNFANSRWDKEHVQRVLTILLKVLPVSTIFALEWTSQREFFFNFYIKLEKSTFLTRSREIMDNIGKSFRTALGADSVRLLEGDELMNHFSMAIPGRFQKAAVSGRYGVTVQTDMINKKKSFALLTPINYDSFNEILGMIDATPHSRMYLPIKKTQKSTFISKSLTLVFGEPIKKDSVQTQLPGSISLSQIPATKALHQFGDVLSRNQIIEQKIKLGFSETAKIIINLLTTRWPLQNESELSSENSNDSKSEAIDSPPWREILFTRLSNFGLPFKKDRVILINGLPTRVDAEIDDMFFFVISRAKDYQLQRFVQRILSFMIKNGLKGIVLLLTQSQKNALVRNGFLDLINNQRIHVVVTKPELELILKEKKTQLLEKKKGIVQVA